VKEGTIAEQAAGLVQRDRTIAEQADAIAQRDVTIAEQAAAAVEKDGTIAGHAATIAALERTTAELEGLLVGVRGPGVDWRHRLSTCVTCPRLCAPGPRFVEHVMSWCGPHMGRCRLRRGPACDSGTRRWLSVSGSWWGCVRACFVWPSSHAGEGDGWGWGEWMVLGWRE
jgi:hypothetical protein